MNRCLLKGGLAVAVVLLFVIGFSSSGLAADLDSARVIPKGKVLIYEGDQKVGELSSEAPLPAGKILTSNEKCGVRLDGIYLVADENTRFSVRTLSGGTDIFVEEGRLHFALSSTNQMLSFSTPQDTVTVQSTLINASTDTSTIRGYLLFENNRMEIGVIDGGKLVVANARGQQMIESGSSLQFQNVQAQLGAGGAGAGAGGMGAAAAGAAAAGAAGLGVVATGTSATGDNPQPDPEDRITSPFAP